MLGLPSIDDFNAAALSFNEWAATNNFPNASGKFKNSIKTFKLEFIELDTIISVSTEHSTEYSPIIAFRLNDSYLALIGNQKLKKAANLGCQKVNVVLLDILI